MEQPQVALQLVALVEQPQVALQLVALQLVEQPQVALSGWWPIGVAVGVAAGLIVGGAVGFFIYLAAEAQAPVPSGVGMRIDRDGVRIAVQFHPPPVPQ